MKIYRCCLFIVLSILIVQAVQAQTNGSSPGLKVIAPPSPNASSLGKYGDVPVGYYTGIPSISVPIHTIKSHELELPISLSYHAGGIKVEEVASWVGLGFSLQAGGAITRSMRGREDEHPLGYFALRSQIKTLSQTYVSAPSSLNVGNAQSADLTTLYNINGGGQDSQPDIFYFNFGSYSGKFFMDENGNFVTMPVQKLKIDPPDLGTISGENGITRWTVTTPDGVKYIFGSSLDGTRVGTDKCNNGSNNLPPLSSWYLVEVLSPNDPNNNYIKLSYTQESYSYKTKPSEAINYLIESSSTSTSAYYDPVDHYPVAIATNFFSNARLTGINFPNGSIEFTATIDREDVPGSKRLEGIVVKDRDGNVLKKFNLLYSYSTGLGNCPNGSGYCRRLYLDKMQQMSNDGSLKTGDYVFGYNNTQLPTWDPDSGNPNFNAQDLWGFYNGHNNNAHLPRSFAVDVGGGNTIGIKGGERHSDEASMQAGTLTSITYPTGGKTLFEYEANRVYTSERELGFIAPLPIMKNLPSPLVIVGGTTTSIDFTIKDSDPSLLYSDIAYDLVQMVDGNYCARSPSSGVPGCYMAVISPRPGTTSQSIALKETGGNPNGDNLGTQHTYLYPGDYTLTGTSTVSGKIIHGSMTWYEYPQVDLDTKSDKVIGGLRIAKMTNIATDGTSTIKRYSYQDPLTGNSSGSLVNFPVNFFIMYTYYGMINNVSQYAIYAQLRSQTLLPLTATQGSVLGYKNVSEIEGQNAEYGHTDYTFTTVSSSPLQYGDQIKNYRPYPPNCSFDWRRGLLMKKEVYRNGQSTPIQTVDNVYTFQITPAKAYGIMVDRGTFDGSLHLPEDLFVAGYETDTEFFYHQIETTRNYSTASPSSYSTVVKNYEYGWQAGHYLLTKTSIVDSQGKQVDQVNKYPQDLTLTGAAETARQALINKFILSPVLEQDVLENQVQTLKTVRNYNVFANGLFPSSIAQQVGTAALDNRVNFIGYDAFGNLLEQAKKSDASRSYVWDYNNEYPIAEVINANKDSIAYTSFEADGAGNWTIAGSSRITTDARTGNRSYDLTQGNISKTGLVQKATYKVTFWSKGGTVLLNGTARTPVTTRPAVNGWNYYEEMVTGSTTVTAATLSATGSTAVLIDDVRFYPRRATMTTYSYSPGVGVHWVLDANNRATRFDYDALGRLEVVRDDDGKIVKTYKYNYKQ